MQIKVTYDKATGDITLSNDTKLITLELNTNATVDTSDSLYFEIAVDTTEYEVDQMDLPEYIIDEE
jgi:polyisoprenoid-binding protein YceI